MAQFGWKAGTEQYPPEELLDYAIAAEEAGFDFLDSSDHFHPWSEAGQASFTWTWLGSVAARTNRMQLGPGVTCPILRYHPAIIAQAAATLDALAPGRAYLCVGTGEALNEYSAMAQWPPYIERQKRLAEAIELIRELWTGESITFRGKYYQTRKARLYTLPSTPIPLYVSTIAPGSADFAGRYGDGFITVGGLKPEIYQQIFQQFEAGARQSGKDPAPMPRMIELGVAFTDQIDQAVQVRQQYWAGTYILAAFNQNIYFPQQMEMNSAVVGKDAIMERACISPDPEAHVRFSRQHLELGFDHLVFHSAGPDQREFLEGYGREVLPRLREP